MERRNFSNVPWPKSQTHLRTGLCFQGSWIFWGKLQNIIFNIFPIIFQFRWFHQKQLLYLISPYLELNLELKNYIETYYLLQNLYLPTYNCFYTSAWSNLFSLRAKSGNTKNWNLRVVDPRWPSTFKPAPILLQYIYSMK